MEKVFIKLFKDIKHYTEDVFVAINGKSYLIQRGVEVEVPISVAKVLQHAHNMEIKVKQNIEALKANT